MTKILDSKADPGLPAVAPSDGLIVNKGDVLEFALAPQCFDQEKQFENQIAWKFRQLKGDGSLTQWASFGNNGNGTTFEDNSLTAIGGIYQFKAVITSGGQEQEHPYVRSKDAKYGADSDGNVNPIYKKGQPDYVGVVDEQWQINVRGAALSLLGKPGYAKADNKPVYPGGPSTAGLPKCNIFVYDACIAGGTVVPLATLDDGTNWPPTAKKWWNSSFTITGWDNLMQTYPQPGYVVSRPGTHVTIFGKDYVFAGHMGIVDYDGGWLNAGSKTVNKFPHITPPDNEYQPARFRKTSSP